MTVLNVSMIIYASASLLPYNCISVIYNLGKDCDISMTVNIASHVGFNDSHVALTTPEFQQQQQNMK